MRPQMKILLGLTSLAIGGQAFAVTPMYNFRDNDRDQYVTYVDFSTTTTDSTHYQWTTFAQPITAAQVKYMDFKLRSFSSSFVACLEYKAYKPNGHGDTDVTMWALTSAGWKMLADDTLGVYPTARISLSGSPPENSPALRLSTWDTTGNNGAVMLQVTELPLTKAECEATTGPLYKWPTREIVNPK
jgi:hypothetical protein